MAVNPETLEALTSGIQSEVAAYVFYLEASKKIEKSDIKDTLKMLAGEEKKHFQILEGQYDSLVRSEKWISTADILNQPGLPDIGEDMQEKHRNLIDRVNDAASQREILEMALRLEEEARDLFHGLAENSDSEEGKKTFTHLAGFEEGHVRLINDLIAKLAD